MKYFYVAYHDKNKHGEIIKSNDYPDMRKLGLSSCSSAYDSEEELIKREGLRTDIRCKMCGDWIKTNYRNYNEYKDLNICFSCNHWNEIYKTQNHPNRFIINGTSYWMQSKEKVKGFCGFDGRLFKIQRLNSKEIIETRNLWCQGDIPKIWLDLIKDNAKFI